MERVSQQNHHNNNATDIPPRYQGDLQSIGYLGKKLTTMKLAILNIKKAVDGLLRRSEMA
jgi:hypothetical protein